MGHFSRAQFTPPSGSTSGSATRAWFGNSELFLFGLNTAPQVFTAVTASVVAYAHLNGVSLHVHLDDWLIKTHIGRVSQTANPMVIGPLHTPRLGGKCGEVKPDSFTCGHLLMGISLDTRVGLAYPSERRIERWLSISGIS